MIKAPHIKRYSELNELQTFQEKLEYLKLDGSVGEDTFGYDRYLNQQFYTSAEWKRIRNLVIVRDSGCDLGDKDHPISGKIFVHHMNPITKDDIVHSSTNLMNPDYLICVSFDTHNIIHYGDISNKETENIERAPNDTCPWRQ